MADIYKMLRGYTGIKSLTLSKLLYLETGLINTSSPSIDVTTTGNTTLLTAPAGIIGIDIANLKFMLLGNNTVGGLIASVGTNSPNFDNILAATTFTAFNTIGEIWREPLKGKVPRVLPGEVITMRVTNSVSGVGGIVNVFMTGEIITT